MRRQEDIITLLEDRSIHCPICNDTKWGIEPTGNMIPNNQVKNMVYDVIVSNCKTCGYVLLFNVVES